MKSFRVMMIPHSSTYPLLFHQLHTSIQLLYQNVLDVLNSVFKYNYSTNHTYPNSQQTNNDYVYPLFFLWTQSNKSKPIKILISTIKAPISKHSLGSRFIFSSTLVRKNLIIPLIIPDQTLQILYIFVLKPGSIHDFLLAEELLYQKNSRFAAKVCFCHFSSIGLSTWC